MKKIEDKILSNKQLLKSIGKFPRQKSFDVSWGF